VSRSALDLLAELIDAAEQVDDYVTGVVGLASGRAGGDVEDESWWGKVRFGRRSVVESFGAAYGPEQLRKAAVEAARMAPLIDELRTTGAVRELMSRLDDLGVDSMAQELRELAPVDARDVQQRLSRALAAMRETRTRLLLAR